METGLLLDLTAVLQGITVVLGLIHLPEAQGHLVADLRVIHLEVPRDPDPILRLHDRAGAEVADPGRVDVLHQVVEVEINH